mmetsp:Transcript_5532/g.706  ORF Transcript_5532/g.706 Transcript_5532/m.706 type:complete len:88 (+) Transcript_5532:597-860(+)
MDSVINSVIYLSAILMIIRVDLALLLVTKQIKDNVMLIVELEAVCGIEPATNKTLKSSLFCIKRTKGIILPNDPQKSVITLYVIFNS